MKKALILLNLMTAFSALSMLAQTTPDKQDTGKVANEQVNVVGSYDPRLMDFPKKNFSPVVENDEVVKNNLKYSVFPQPMKVVYQASPIKAAKMAGEPFTELYGNYIKAGFGSGKTPYGELFLNTKRDKHKAVGLHLKHFSTSGKIPDFAFPGTSENEVNLYGSRIRPKNTAYGKLFFDRDVYHYYGFNPEGILDTIENDAIRQRYNDAGAELSLYSTHSDSSHLNYRFGAKYHGFWDINNASESSADLNAHIGKRVKWLGVSKYQGVGIDLRAEHYFNHRKYTRFNAGLVELSPYIHATLGKMFLLFSPRLSMETDSNSEAYIFPHIRMELNLLPGTLSAFGEFDGNLNYHSYRLLAGENPFIHRFIDTDYSVMRRKLSGGIRGNIAHRFSYTIQAIQRDTDHCPMFVNDTLTYMNNWMGVVYDDVKWFRAEFSSELKIKEKWRAGLLLAFNQAEAVEEEEVWNMPQFEGRLGITYLLADKFIVTTQVFYFGDRFARHNTDAGFETVKLKGFLDANLSIEYRYSKVLSAFLQFNNIAAQRYMIWDQYPSYRFRFLGGVTYSF